MCSSCVVCCIFWRNGVEWLFLVLWRFGLVCEWSDFWDDWVIGWLCVNVLVVGGWIGVNVEVVCRYVYGFLGLDGEVVFMDEWEVGRRMGLWIGY